MRERAVNLKIRGQAISPGLVIGKVFVHHDFLQPLLGSYEIQEHQIEPELERFEHATKAVAEDLRVSAKRIERDTNEKLAAIFEAHEAMLQDPGLREEISDLVKEEWISAAHALSRVFRRRERKFRKMTEQMHQRHADDVADLGRRLLREVAGVKSTPLEKMPPDRVLVARRLLPSDTVALPRRAVLAIVVEFGGPGSHAAMLAEALGIPTVAQVANVTETVVDDDVVIVDGRRGEVTINPDKPTEAGYTEEIRDAAAHTAKVIQLARKPAATQDGTVISVLANVGGREDVAAAAHHGAEGVGLYRLEQFYLARKTPPTEAELLSELQGTFAPLKGKPITVRLLDLGGDKPLPFMILPAEDDPFLGQRGVRFLLRFPDLLETQLHALCELAADYDIRVLVPMVTLAEEMESIRGRLTAVARGKRMPPLGAMIETPAAALSIADIKAHSDFLSIGTNDLTQYTMAAGRENPLVNEYFREDHPAMFRLMSIIVEEAGATPVTLCGELARQLSAIPALLRLGIRILSVAPPLVPEVKEAIRQLTLRN